MRDAALRRTGMRTPLYAQPDAITCGPTCLAMVQHALLARQGVEPSLDPFHVGAMCDTNPVTGTVREGVETALSGLGIAAHWQSGRPRAAENAASALADGDVVLCRTLTHGIRHWILADEISGPGETPTIGVNDPWLGRLRLSLDDLRGLIAPRDNEICVIPSRQRVPDVRVVPIVDSSMRPVQRAVRRHAALDIAIAVFGHLGSWVCEDYLMSTSTLELSRGVTVDGRLVAVYLLTEGALPRYVPGDVADVFCGFNGVQGVALACTPEARGLGYGRLLRDEPRRMGCDFVFGLHHKDLGNLENWLRHRTLLHEDSECFVTGTSFNPLLDLSTFAAQKASAASP